VEDNLTEINYQPVDAERIHVITLEENVLQKNDEIAAENRALLKNQEVIALNLISSPGSGKTTLLEKTLSDLKGELRCAVIEGDQQTSNDAARIAATQVPVVQINTLSGCHLEAAQVRTAMKALPMKNIDLLLIENIGNLVCPSAFDLGEFGKVAIMSITEGEDKPIKYPLLFHQASVIVLTKLDLLPYLRFSLERCKEYIRRVNLHAQIIETSVFNGNGLAIWEDYLRNLVNNEKNKANT
jgi:hydrogenase nickel incorporation protein HypB